MSYGNRGEQKRPDPYNRSSYPKEKGYHWENHNCNTCRRNTAWIGAGRENPNIIQCTDCGSEMEN